MKPYEARNIKALIACCGSGQQPRYVFFWGHNPPKDNSINQSCLSQWYVAPFTSGQTHYPTAEHYMMAEKARLFDDSAILEKILKSKSPGEVKVLGRQVENFDYDVWEKQRWEIVVRANYLKFQQNPNLYQYLIATRKRVLVEASPQDRIWGIGLAAKDKLIYHPSYWRGLNLLGFALMEVRQQLINDTGNFESF